jgi:hypothetical protein
MNVETMTEAAQFLFGEYIHRILFAVHGRVIRSKLIGEDKSFVRGPVSSFTLIKIENQIFLIIRKFRVEQLQSHKCGKAS